MMKERKCEMSKKKNEVRSDAFAFCHGMLGFGEDELVNKVMPYFGGAAGSIPKRLKKQGYEACAPSFSSLGSAWDRACEVYASLTGTRVDYGKAHSKKYGHDRYGKVYTEAKLPNWGKVADDGEIQRLHILGHSFGGATVRMFAHLMEFGSAEERAVTDPDDLSPLFAGGHGDLVKSVTTIAGPHDGTVVIDALRPVILPVGRFICYYGFGNLLGNTPFRRIYDMQLIQWKMTSDRDKLLHPTRMLRIGKVFKLWKSGDDVFYDLTLKGAKEINEFVETSPNSYYFSISTDNSKRKKDGTYRMKWNTFPPFFITGKAIGTCTHDPSLDIDIDEWWRVSDGASCTNSALHPSDEDWVDYKDAKDDLKKGIWNVMPVYQGDHMDVVGLSPQAFLFRRKYRKRYRKYIDLLLSLK